MKLLSKQSRYRCETDNYHQDVWYNFKNTKPALQKRRPTTIVQNQSMTLLYATEAQVIKPVDEQRIQSVYIRFLMVVKGYNQYDYI